MPGIPSPFGDDEETTFGAYDEWAPAAVPDPGPFLADHDVLTGEDHLAVHRTARDCFEERGVYDVTFGYNLARLNLDERHPDAGYRYAASSEADDVLLAEFTPTTPFCPQSHTLTKASFRAWNGLRDRHEYDLVRVRLAPMHDEAEAINEELADLEATFQAEGTLPGSRTGSALDGASQGGTGLGTPSDGDGPASPF